MKKTMRIWLALLLAAAFGLAPSGFSPVGSISAAQQQPERKQVKVWVNTKSGVYHCPGSRWYGKTKRGKYMGECAAQKAGYRAAYGKPCGSTCQ